MDSLHGEKYMYVRTETNHCYDTKIENTTAWNSSEKKNGSPVNAHVHIKVSIYHTE